MADSEEKSHLGHFEPVKETLAKYRDQLDALRKAIEGDLKEDDDVMLYRFLRGYQFDVERASAALNKSLKWRKENKVDEIHEKVVKLTPEEFPYADKVNRVNPSRVHHGFDKKGQPIGLALAGRSDPLLLTKTITEDQLKEYMIYHMEYKRHLLSKLTTETGKIYRSHRIVDLTGLGSKHLSPKGLKTLRNVIGLVQENYPESAGNIVYVNAPWIFTSLWAIVKPWIQPATLEKIQVLGASYQEELLKRIDAKTLPKYLGGECTCADKGGCVHQVDPDEGFTKITVGYSAAQEVTVEVPAADAKEGVSSHVVTWEFRTESNNIDFEVVWKPKTGAESVITKKARVESHLQMIDGGFETKEAGTVTLNFDNKFSWTASKLVIYSIHVTPKTVDTHTDKTEKATETTTTTTAPAAASDTAAAATTS